MDGSSLLRVLVGPIRLPNGNPVPTLVVEAEPERLEALRMQVARADAASPMLFRQAVLADNPQAQVTWFRYSDSRLNGILPLQRWQEFYPNLQLEGEEILSTETLARILSDWPAATDCQLDITLTLGQGDPIQVLEGVGAWLPRIRRIELHGPKADALWLEPCDSWLQQHGYRLDPEYPLCWVLDAQAAELIRKQAELEALRTQLASTSAEHQQELQQCGNREAQIMEALHHTFPHAAYREMRPDLAEFDDHSLVEHFVAHGIHEGVDLKGERILSESQRLRTEIAEAAAKLALQGSKADEVVSILKQQADTNSVPAWGNIESTGMEAWLVNSRLYLRVPEEYDSIEAVARPTIHKGSHAYSMEEARWSEQIISALSSKQHYNLLSLENRQRLTVSTAGEHGEMVESGINQLPDWSLIGGDTLHIRISEPNQGLSIEVMRELQVETLVRERWVFECLIASHRASGSLEVTCRHDDTTKTYSVDFDSSKTGGLHPEGYLSATLDLPMEIGRSEISLSINHVVFTPDDNPNASDTYYFVANPQIYQHGFRSHLVPRELKEHQAPGPRGLLYRGRVSQFSSPQDSCMMLSLGDGKVYEVFSPLNNEVTLKEDYSHTLVVRADREGMYSLFVNGEFCELVRISREDTQLRIPSQWLRGEPVLVEVRDGSGSQVFLRLPMLPPRHLSSAELLLQETKPPFPTDLTVRANHRYQALREHLEQPVKGVTTDMLLRALRTLDRNHETLELEPLEFPIVNDPVVSVVIPAHNKVQVTYYALCALLLAHNSTSFEVVLVDDGSTDETTEIEHLVSGITVIHNAEPLRFIKACNRGVSEARGKYVVLLNNDTEVTVGWLDALVDAFTRFEAVGAVGSKLLYPDGRLQDAGGIIWGSGNPWNYGNGQNPWDPRFCYTRQVDYLSGAALMTTKTIWDEVGGLSHYLEPMYFEDTDFAFKVREAGYKTYYVPSSVVYHFEGTTSGTDTSRGFKKYQEVNRPRFKRRWAKDFARHGEEGIQPDLEKDRGIAGRILFIDYTTPREDRDAGSYAAIREIELVQSLGYKVTFLPQNLAYFGSYTEELQRSGVEVITAPFYRSLADFLADRAEEFVAAYITRYYVAADTVHLIRKYSPKTRILLNNADLHFLRELRTAVIENDEARLEVMRDIRDQELAIMRSVDLVLSYNEVEHAVISSHTDGKVKVMTCPWVVDIPIHVAPLADRAGVSFLGSFKHHPNNEGVTWFCREVMPQLETQKLKLSIYGSGMDDEIKGLANEWIEPVGYIEDVADAYQQHRVFVAPLLSGAGMKGKVVHALAYGIPTVLSPTAAEGIGLRHGHDCLIAKTTQEWVDSITLLTEDDELWKAISAAARSYAASQFSFAAGKEKMMAALEAVDLFSHIGD